MALLEKLEQGNIYLVKISASNQVGDGPFSSIVELALQPGNTHRGKSPRHSEGRSETTGTFWRDGVAKKPFLIGLNVD